MPTSQPLNFKKMAEDALGITRQMEGPRDSGTYFDLGFKNSLVSGVMAALAQAYGEGVAEGIARGRER